MQKKISRNFSTVKIYHELMFYCFNGLTAETWWQVKYIQTKLKSYKDNKLEIFSDEGQTLFIVKNGEKTPIGKGKIALFCDRLEICSEVLRFEDISKMSLSMSDNILLTTSDGNYYEIRTNHPRSALRYLMAVRYFQGKELILR